MWNREAPEAVGSVRQRQSSPKPTQGRCRCLLGPQLAAFTLPFRRQKCLLSLKVIAAGQASELLPRSLRDQIPSPKPQGHCSFLLAAVQQSRGQSRERWWSGGMVRRETWEGQRAWDGRNQGPFLPISNPTQISGEQILVSCWIQILLV